jgi:hypothetical protein
MRAPTLDIAAGRVGFCFVIACDLLDQGADALGLQDRVLYDGLQIGVVGRAQREEMAVLLDLAHIEQQRGQRTVKLLRDRSSRLVHGPHARCRQACDFGIVGNRAVVDPLGWIAEAVFVLWHIRCLTDGGLFYG